MKRATLIMATTSLIALGAILFLRAPVHPGGSRWHGLAALLAVHPAHHLVRRLRERGRDRLDVAVIPDGVYLGRGFEWTPAHARTLMDRAGEAWDGSQIHAIGRPIEQDLFLPSELLGQHMLVLGTTGVGKTRMLELLATSAIRRGDATAVIDPKGDDRLLARVIEESTRARRPFALIAPPFPAASRRYNPLERFNDVREIADRVAALLPCGGDAEPFRNFGWELIATTAAAMVRLGRTPTLTELRRCAVEDPWRLARELVPGVKDTDKLAAKVRAMNLPELDALIAFAGRPRDHSMKMASSLLPVLAKLTTGSNGELLSTSGWSWESFDRGRGVAYFYLGSLLGADTASAVAKLALLDFQAHLGARYAFGQGDPITLVVDELGDVITPSFISCLNKGRGAGARLILAGQTLADLEAALGSEARARQVTGNVNTIVQFRAQSQEDADAFAALAGDRLLPVSSEGEAYEPALLSSGFREVDDFRAVFSRQRTWRAEALVPAWAVMQLPVFHYFARWEGRAVKGIVPLLPAASGTPVEAIRHEARRNRRGVGGPDRGVGMDAAA